MWYYIGVKINNGFLKENSIKLISDNIFLSDKIRNHIELPSSLDYLFENQYQQNRK